MFLTDTVNFAISHLILVFLAVVCMFGTFIGGEWNGPLFTVHTQFIWHIIFAETNKRKK